MSGDMRKHRVEGSHARTLTILTPLYDPTGSARELFGRCVASVEAQEGTNLRWIVSVQEAAASYDTVLEELRASGQATVVRRSGFASLSDHLSASLGELADQRVHILCQDDRYTVARSAAMISAALDRRPLVYVEPRLATGDASRVPAVESATRRQPKLGVRGRRRALMARSGVNRMGGLSTIAFGPGFRLDRPLKHELMVDLELRERLEWRLGDPGLLTGGVVTEAVWAGQSQNSLVGRERDEAEAWVHAHGQVGVGRLTSSILAGAMRQHALAAAWAGSGSGPVIGAGRLLVPVGDVARAIWRWRRS